MSQTPIQPTTRISHGVSKVFVCNNSPEAALPVQVTGSNAGQHESITVDNTAGGKAFTTAKIAGMRYAFVTVETAQVRFTIDGTAPTTTVGHLLEIGDILKLDSAEDLAAFRAIRTGSTSATIHCTYSA